MLEILYKIHPEPKGWLSSMGVVSMERVVAVAQGCEALAIAGLSYREIRRAIQMSPSALDALIDGNHERALSLAKNVLPQQRRDVIAPVTGEWVEFPDTQDTAEGSEENPLMAVDGPGGIGHYFEVARDGKLHPFLPTDKKPK